MSGIWNDPKFRCWRRLAAGADRQEGRGGWEAVAHSMRTFCEGRVSGVAPRAAVGATRLATQAHDRRVRGEHGQLGVKPSPPRCFIPGAPEMSSWNHLGATTP